MPDQRFGIGIERTAFAFDRVVALLARGIPVTMSVDTVAVTGNADFFALLHVLIDTEFALAGNATSITARKTVPLRAGFPTRSHPGAW